MHTIFFWLWVVVVNIIGALAQVAVEAVLL